MYKSRPSVKFCKHLLGITGRYDKHNDSKSREFYLAVYDYIQYNKSFIEFKLNDYLIESKGITIALLSNTSCKINIKK